jgi:hypothetical protein
MPAVRSLAPHLRGEGGVRGPFSFRDQTQHFERPASPLTRAQVRATSPRKERGEVKSQSYLTRCLAKNARLRCFARAALALS